MRGRDAPVLRSVALRNPTICALRCVAFEEGRVPLQKRARVIPTLSCWGGLCLKISSKMTSLLYPIPVQSLRVNRILVKERT